MGLKQQTELRYIYKIHSARLRRAKWNLELSFEEAIKNKEVISLSDGQMIRFIDDINKYEIDKEKINKIKKQINKIKQESTTLGNRKQIRQLQIEKNELTFIKDYVCVIMDKNSDFDRCNIKKGFTINGIKYKRLVGTTGGIKKETVAYINEKIYKQIDKKINNGRNKEIPLVPAKLEAYKSLTCSTSIPVSAPKGVLVIKDGETNFVSDVIKIDDSNSKYPIMNEVKDYPINLQFCDGCGMILPSLSKKWANDLKENLKEKEYISGFCIRNSFCKGMVFTFDFLDFAKNVAHNYFVKDVWGNKIDIRNVEIVITTNMLKLWNCYKSIDDYLNNCKENGYTFSVTKYCPKELENERTLNYQFLQSYNFTDEDINKLISPTVNEIKDVLGGDYRKSLLFLKGIHMTDRNCFNSGKDLDFVKALMTEPEMINDPFIKQKIFKAIEKRIKDAKIGVLKVRGNYQIISGDLYALCEYMFGMKVKGLLKSDEYYSRAWLDKKVNEVVAFRAPMTCHNNIRIMNFIDNNKVRYWYRYMTTCIVLNAWDTTTQAMNGEDFDSDFNITTDNEILLKNTKKLPALLCMQKSAKKIIVTENDLIKSNKAGFGDEIGQITNRITSMFEVVAKFKEGTKEYDELMYRIQCGQHYQQCAIDKTKGIVSNSMPKEWYDYKENKIEKEDKKEQIKRKEFNLKILANKKPYFFIYIYSSLMNLYKKYIRDTNEKSIMRFGIDIQELIYKEIKNKEENEFLKYYYEMMPVGINPCVLNKICWKIEREFDDFSNKISNKKFDYTILKSNIQYKITDYDNIKNLYKEYKQSVRQYYQKINNERIDKQEKKDNKERFKNEFKDKAYRLCNNKYELCNILVDMCYKNNLIKQFVWDIVGDVIVENLLIRNNYIIKYPVMNKKGNIKFGGYNFSMQQKYIKKKGDNN